MTNHTNTETHMKFYGAATVGTKGQVVIPAEARDVLCISEGDKLLAMGMPMNNVVIFVKADSLEAMMQEIQRNLSEIQKAANEQMHND